MARLVAILLLALPPLCFSDKTEDCPTPAALPHKQLGWDEGPQSGIFPPGVEPVCTAFNNICWMKI